MSTKPCIILSYLLESHSYLPLVNPVSTYYTYCNIIRGRRSRVWYCSHATQSTLESWPTVHSVPYVSDRLLLNRQDICSYPLEVLADTRNSLFVTALSSLPKRCDSSVEKIRYRQMIHAFGTGTYVQCGDYGGLISYMFSIEKEFVEKKSQSWLSHQV